MLEYLFYLLVAFVILMAFVNWRAALYMCIVLDILRDPIRKMDVSHSLLIAQSVNIVWAVITLIVVAKERSRIRDLMRRHRQLRIPALLICLAVLPGAAVSVVGYQNGWLLALLGAASYLAVIPGSILGYSFARHQKDISRFLGAYCLAKAIAFAGALLEYFDANVPGLGGIGVKWIRYQGNSQFDLISGFYRSPDVLGLHAATVCVFAGVLGTTRRKGGQLPWYFVVLWAAVPLLLSGRRKMIGIPFIFAISVLYLQLRYMRRIQRSGWYTLFAAMGILCFFLLSGSLGMGDIYRQYASTIVAEGSDKVRVAVYKSPFESLRQSGLLGRGLGTATQGSQHIMGRSLTWQEDGGGRLFVELGLVGATLLLIAGILVALRCKKILDRTPIRAPHFHLQIGLASVLVANAACFLVSHQAFSGDPWNMGTVLFCLGLALSFPTQVRVRPPERRRKRSVLQTARRQRPVTHGAVEQP
jgi:hypothetical protein